MGSVIGGQQLSALKSTKQKGISQTKLNKLAAKLRANAKKLARAIRKGVPQV